MRKARNKNRQEARNIQTGMRNYSVYAPIIAGVTPILRDSNTKQERGVKQRDSIDHSRTQVASKCSLFTNCVRFHFAHF
jgi:hypothetical protein